GRHEPATHRQHAGHAESATHRQDATHPEHGMRDQHAAHTEHATHDQHAAHAGHATHAGHDEHAGHDKHAGHSPEMFRNRFWLSLALTIPVVFYADMIQFLLCSSDLYFPSTALVDTVVGHVNVH